jgi:Fur family transcriptional regulator, peroxide stress response regulator
MKDVAGPSYPRMPELRERCRQAGLSLTHQRLVIYEALQEMGEHPSPEAVYDRVKEQLPSVSLATVYNNIKTFVEHGLLQELSVHHGSLRLENNLTPHHHLVCTRCKTIEDIGEEEFDAIRLKNPPPDGFLVHRFSVEVLGLCSACARQSTQ